ncbi:hypothetical protein [Cohnella herbarum]|uniref:Uncharacterized protein n=1 Tax=Cohnella herbarum TaxID=2728023 RepID=A0A7Z2VN02_9BACL|nr:hypothetical protein [Cohnella herbarum]QJD85930.1 hypothetical protein HH215_23965 [Cohnella herbarum]
MEKVESVFRKHPELEPTGKLSLLGKASCSAEMMDAYLRRRSLNAPPIADMYLRLGERYGIRGDAAFCQMISDTRGWTLEISGPSWFPRTLAQWSEETSVEAHMQILYSFATEYPLPMEENAVQRQITLIGQSGWRGRVHCWEDLNGKWSDPGNHRYGQGISAVWRSMLEWTRRGDVDRDRERDQPQRQIRLRSGTLKERTIGSVDWSSFSSEQMRWLQEQRLLPTPAPHPDRKVTWAELAALLQHWEKRSSTATIEEEKVSS